MNYKKRLLEDKLTLLSQHFPIIVLTGARQVGKSTLFKHLHSEAQHIVFDPVIDIGNARQDPELFLNHLRLPVILDEIQYAPELLPAIKRRVDEKPGFGQYWLTGSQNLSVLKSVSESLAGRAAILSLYPMTLAEYYDSATSWLASFFADPQAFLKKQHSLLTQTNEQTLVSVVWKGGYPGLMTIDNSLQADALESYFRTYIERDVRLISEVSDLQLFARFVELLANLTAQEILFNHLGRELGISPQTAQRWVNLLKSTYQWLDIPPYAGNTIKRISGKSKGYFVDTGMCCYLMHISTANALLGHPKLGSLFETFIVNDILRQFPLLPGKPAVYHWRSHGGAEVDLVLELDNIFYLIEIKCKTQPNKNDIRGIQAFRATYPHLKYAPALVICAAKQVLPLGDDCFAVPFDIV